jgi:hypothetical protein
MKNFVIHPKRRQVLFEPFEINFEKMASVEFVVWEFEFHFIIL